MMLEKEMVLQLLAEADTKWFNQHPAPSSTRCYRAHLEFTAEYIVKKYGKKKSKHEKVSSKHDRNKVYRLL